MLCVYIDILKLDLMYLCTEKCICRYMHKYICMYVQVQLNVK